MADAAVEAREFLLAPGYVPGHRVFEEVAFAEGTTRTAQPPVENFESVTSFGFLTVSRNFLERVQETIDFLASVVVDEADAEEASRLFDVEMLGQIERVVVAVPGEQTALSQLGGEIERSVVLDPHRECPATSLPVGGIGDAINRECRNFLQAGDHAFDQGALVLTNGGVGGFDGGATGDFGAPRFRKSPLDFAPGRLRVGQLAVRA